MNDDEELPRSSVAQPGPLSNAAPAGRTSMTARRRLPGIAAAA